MKIHQNNEAARAHVHRKHTHARSSLVKILVECHDTHVKFSYHFFHHLNWGVRPLTLYFLVQKVWNILHFLP